jgi:hypothetical protein
MTVERQIRDEPHPFIKVMATGIETVCPLCEKPFLHSSIRRGYVSCCGHHWARTHEIPGKKWVLVEKWTPSRIRVLMG